MDLASTIRHAAGRAAPSRERHEDVERVGVEREPDIRRAGPWRASGRGCGRSPRTPRRHRLSRSSAGADRRDGSRSDTGSPPCCGPAPSGGGPALGRGLVADETAATRSGTRCGRGRPAPGPWRRKAQPTPGPGGRGSRLRIGHAVGTSPANSSATWAMRSSAAYAIELPPTRAVEVMQRTASGGYD